MQGVHKLVEDMSLICTDIKPDCVNRAFHRPVLLKIQ